MAASELQRLPESRLRRLAASSVGLGLGFYLAGAPRLIVAAVSAAALLMGAAIALRHHLVERVFGSSRIAGITVPARTAAACWPCPS